ncbi:unnamed protein product [Pelagomonas calceolata]|uniref:EGF-like domain-containing protein n=1 Tax=Pelagomonas calceolata TaxID=35677 RepID=A0A8J2SC12_9STRA|nr:unnamed protein product [Pelagomonas calceolata]
MARRVANLLALAAAAAAAAAKCEVLRSLEFQQHTAPKGVSELLGPVVSLVSEKAAEVGDIKIRWDGELGLHRVGTHKITAENSDGACFETIIVVKDTDECTATGAWAHKCDASATCKNLVGSYACECSPDYFAAEGALFGCGGFASTTQCCDAAEDEAACLAAFRCEASEIERLRERATTYGLVAAVAVALCIITVIVASNAQTASAATARASLTPPRPAPKVVSYQFLAPDDSAKEPYQSPFDSPTI